MHETPPRFEELLTPVIRELGLELWGIEYMPRERSSLLRVYIDKTGGVSIADCEVASRHMAALMDVENPIPGRYFLEVSSPGLERVLFRAEQFQRFVGERIRVRFHRLVQGRRRVQGILRAVSHGEAGNDWWISVQDGEQEHAIHLSDIARAQLAPPASSASRNQA